MNKFTSPNITLLTIAVIISLLSACGGGGGGGTESSNSGFTANNNTNTKPQTSSAESSATQASSKSSASSAANSSRSTESFMSSNASEQLNSSESSTLATQSSSISSSISSTAKVTIDTIAPAMVTEINIEFTEYDIAVFSWTAAIDNIGVSAYKIYRNQIQIDYIDAVDLTYVDFNVAPNSTYTYGVSAGDAVGNWSPIKTILAKTQPQPVPPSSASSSNISSSLSSASSSLSSSSAKSSAHSTSSSSLSSSSSKSSSRSNSSLSSSSSSVDVTAPSAPNSASQILVLATRVDIAWTEATDNVGVTAYRIYRDNVLLSTVSANILEYSDKTTAPNKLYTYSLEAGDAAGNWSATRKSIFITTPIEAATGDVTLYWAPPTQRYDESSISTAELGGFLIRYKSKTDPNYTFININNSSINSQIIANISSDYDIEIAAYDLDNLYSPFVALSPK